MYYVIRLVGLVSGEASEDEGRYVCAIGSTLGDERAFLSTTADISQALSFDTGLEAFEFWHTAPTRAFHAVIEAVPAIAEHVIKGVRA